MDRDLERLRFLLAGLRESAPSKEAKRRAWEEASGAAFWGELSFAKTLFRVGKRRTLTG